MEEKFVQVLVCECVRCGHCWNSKSDKKPVCCARCRSRNWWLEAGINVAMKPKKEKPARSYQRYEFDKIAVGQTRVYPWIRDAGSFEQCLKASKTRHASLMQYQRRSGRRFYAEGTKEGLQVTRIS